ncbi:MAG: hypothetical protein QOK33_252, partial [Mycobacterium sp.]|nr:hypothetical protein [Mycobacterium sp.]
DDLSDEHPEVRTRAVTKAVNSEMSMASLGRVCMSSS